MTHRQPLAHVVAVAALLACASAAAQTPPSGREAIAAWRDSGATSDRLIVKYRSGRLPAPATRGEVALQVAANRMGVQLSTLRQTAGGAHVLRLNRALGHDELHAMATQLRGGDPDIEYAEPDRRLFALATPNDALYAQQWSLSDATGGLRAPVAWDRAKGTGITVAVIDTGVRPHADLAANLLPGYDFIADSKIAGDGGGRDADASDPGDAVAAGFCGSGAPAQTSSWHGTHVAGIVAAVAGNASGIAGIAHGAKLLPLRVLGRCGGYTSDIADAMVWAVGGSVAGLPANPNPARVLNLSLGGSGACDLTTQAAINTARAKGAVVVVAAGNDNADTATATPANCSGVITVAATARSGGKASYSNTGSAVALAAPGGDRDAGILSTLNAGTTTPGADSYVAYMGTSMATPAVAAVAALMLSVNQALTPDQVATMLKSSARAFPAPCPRCGSGLVDAAAAVALAAAAAAPSPAPAPTPAPAPAPATPVAVKEVEPNNTLAKAQTVASLPAVVSGGIASTSDLDHYLVSVAAGRKLIIKLSPGSSLGTTLTVSTASGLKLVALSGSAGQALQVAISNGGASALALVLKLQRAAGSAGAYQLALGY